MVSWLASYFVGCGLDKPKPLKLVFPVYPLNHAVLRSKSTYLVGSK